MLNEFIGFEPFGRQHPIRGQVPGLDGLRGLAALYVVLFHCWLYTFPGYPDSSAPPGTPWMIPHPLAA